MNNTLGGLLRMGQQFIPTCVGAQTITAMRCDDTIESNARADNIAGHWLVSPHTDRYLVPRLSFEGGIFKEQQTTFVYRPVLHHLALKTWTV